MPKKKASDKKKRGNYEQPLEVSASFIDIVKASIKHADKKKPKKKA